MEKSAEELLKAAATSTDEAAKVAELRAAIPATTAGIYLNAGSNGPLPREVDAAMRQVQEQELATGRGSEHVMDDVETRIDELRGVFASVLATDLDLVAVSHSTTEAVMRAVLGIEWKPGDRIVTLDEEYPAIRGSLAALAAEVSLSRGTAGANSFTLVRRGNGSIAGWGYNVEGQLGNGTPGLASDTPTAVVLPAGRIATAVAAGFNHALAEHFTG